MAEQITITLTGVRIRWEHKTGPTIEGHAAEINGYVGTIEPRVFQIWPEETRWVLSSLLPGQFTQVSVDDDTDVLKGEAENWLLLFAESLGASFPGAGNAGG